MKLAVYGYGNLGKGVECAVKQNGDIELVGVFTRRNPDSIKTLTGVKVYPADEIEKFKNKIDVLVICGGSATDLPVMTPALAKIFNVVDSFDTHAKIPAHFENVDKSATESGHIALISAGWDPGMFSLARLYANAILPQGKDYTFWGRGVSQGHSDAIRRVEGVVDARQYTVPIEKAVNSVRNGEFPELTPRDKHLRECFVVAKEGADKAKIENEIKTMPAYFADYDTTVTFISQEEMNEKHSALPHGGSVIRTGKTGMNGEHSHTVEYSIKLDSNPEFTASAVVAFARAVYRMHQRGAVGCKTVFDIAPADMINLTPQQIREKLL